MQELAETFKADGGEFKEIKLEKLFSASNGNFDIQQKHINGLGDYVVSSGVQNSGIIGKSDIDAKIFSHNTITVDMFGNVYYRDFPYKMVTHARVFSLDFINKNINARAGLFISANMQFLNKIFSYSNMASWEKIKKQGISIYLPTKNNQIDFTYMEKYIHVLEKERIHVLEKERIHVLETYLKVTGLDNYELNEKEQEALNSLQNGKIKFKEYKICELFNIQPTKSYKMTNPTLFKNKGSTPVVTNSSAGNGISGYVDLEPTEKGGIITYSDTTTSDGIFYQPNDFIGYSHIQGLYPLEKHLWIDKSLLYFIVLFKKCAAGRFDYATKFNREIAKNMIVNLPLDINNQIDYNFMETYIKAIEKKVIQNVILWKDKEIAKTKLVISENGSIKL